MAPSSRKRVLFVCTGNSCRSVMAQGLLQRRLTQLAHRLTEPVEVSSAGLFAIDGSPASRETVKLLAQQGIDLSGHMAKRLTDEQIREADLILVMEQLHWDEIVRRVPEARAKTHLLKRFGAGDAPQSGSSEVMDPIGKPMEIYEVCFLTIREAVERVAHSLIGSQQAS